MKPQKRGRELSGMPLGSELVELSNCPRLRLVTRNELQTLRESLRRGALPAPFEAKLRRLAAEGVTHYYIEQTSRIFLAIWLAATSGEFRRCHPDHLDLISKVLAYVAKEDDFIPDYLAGGFADDYEIIREAGRQLNLLVQEFKLWRLKHQVPRMWSQPQPEQSGGLFVRIQ